MENCPGGGRRCASQCRECLEEGKAFFVEQAPVSSVSRRHAGTRGTFRDGSLLSCARISSLRIVGPMENADHCPCAVPENGQRGGGAQAASAYLFGMIPEKEKLDETGRWTPCRESPFCIAYMMPADIAALCGGGGDGGAVPFGL